MLAPARIGKCVYSGEPVPKASFSVPLHLRRLLSPNFGTLLCFFVVFLSIHILHAEPQVKQFFPTTSVLLGQELFWLIELRHPMWESYTLTINRCNGAAISIVERKTFEQDGLLQERYRLRIVPEQLTISDTPSVLISDEKGQNIVLTGKPLSVRSISGESTDIRQPTAPNFTKESTKIIPWIPYLIPVLAAILAALLFFKKLYLNSPRNVLMRNLQRAKEDLSRNIYPDYAQKLLRSDLLWGFATDAYTAAELKERSRHDASLSRIADAVHSMECLRYSGNFAHRQVATLYASIRAAIQILQSPLKKEPITRRHQ